MKFIVYDGLIPEAQWNNYVGNGDYLSVFSSYSSAGYGAKQIIKGQLLNFAPVNATYTTMLIRFCVETQTFIVADEALQNINMVEKTRINKDTKYKFGISFNYPGDDYSCLFWDVTTYTDQTLVDKFV